MADAALAVKCPLCLSPTIRLNGNKGPLWICAKYPRCMGRRESLDPPAPPSTPEPPTRPTRATGSAPPAGFAAGEMWVGYHARFGVVIFASSVRKPSANGIALWVAVHRTEVYFERASIKQGLVPVAKAPELAARDFGPEIAEYRQYLWENRRKPPPGEASVSSPADDSAELVPTPGWFTDEGWRRMRSGYRFDSR